MGVCDIIFRAKRIDDGEWIEGFLFSTNEHTYIAYPNQFDDDLFLSPKEIFIEVDHETVCQYTGYKDDTGKKIFEGDIVGFEDMTSTESEIPEVHFRIDGIMLMKIFKEKPQVIGISQPGPRGSVVLDSAEESLAERRQGLQHSPHF